MSHSLRVIYLAHPLSAPTREGIEENRRMAAKWAAWISTTFGVAVSADWIWLTGELEETDANRRWGLACDIEQVSRADELWAVGPRLSDGMREEASMARVAYDFTGVPFPETGAETRRVVEWFEQCRRTGQRHL